MCKPNNHRTLKGNRKALLLLLLSVIVVAGINWYVNDRERVVMGDPGIYIEGGELYVSDQYYTMLAAGNASFTFQNKLDPRVYLFVPTDKYQVHSLGSVDDDTARFWINASRPEKIEKRYLNEDRFLLPLDQE